MRFRHKGLIVPSAFVVLVVVAVAVAKERTWTDTTGKFKVDAELVEVEDGKAVLKKQDGQTIKVPVAKLSDVDQAFLKKQDEEAAASAKNPANAILQEIANKFYADLRSKERSAARQTLTKKAEELMAAGKSPLTGLPQPDANNKAITVNAPKIEGDVAEIPVAVRAGGTVHKTKLHLRKEGDEWQVFALSATYPDGEKSIDFEASSGGSQAENMAALVGKPFQFTGLTLQGKPVDVAEYKDKVVLFDFWATWCGPCRAEIPNIKANYDTFHDAGFDVVAVSVDRDLKALQAFVAEENPPWTVVADRHPRNKSSMGAKYGIQSIPAFILVGKDGNVAAVNCRGPQLGAQLAKLMKGKGSK